MAQQINDNFQLLAGLPIDDRIKKPTITERDAISNTRRFQGLQCFVEQTQTLYILYGGVLNSNWVGVFGGNVADGIETVIEGFYVLSAGKETLLDWEVGDKFRGWIGDRYVVGEILSLPVSLPSDIDNSSKIDLAVDSYAIFNSVSDLKTWVSGTYKENQPVKYLKDGIYYTFVSQIDGNVSEPQLVKSTKPWTQITGSLLGVWNSGTAYVNSNIVTYNGYTYQCITDNTNQNPELLAPPYWIKLGYGSVTYDAETNYFPYSVVNVGAAVYISNLYENSYPLETVKNHYWDEVKQNDIQVISWGDSMTFGTGATLNNSYPSILEKTTGLKIVNKGVPGETSTQIKDRMVSRRDLFQNPVIIWAGRNNYASTATVLADISTMVSELDHDRYLIIGVVRATSNGPTDLDALNNALKTTYGARFLDVQRYLVEQYNPSIPQDVTDHANDNVPFSLRADWLHLNDFGNYFVAKLIANNISFLLNGGDQMGNTQSLQSLKITGNQLPLINSKGIELLYDNVNDKGVIQAYDRLNGLVKPLSLGATIGTELLLVENGGVLKIGILDTYVSGAMKQFAMTNDVPRKVLEIPSVATNYLAKGLASGINEASQVFDNGTEVSIGDASPETGFKFQVNGLVSFGIKGDARLYAGTLDADTAFMQVRNSTDLKVLKLFALGYEFDKPIKASPATTGDELATLNQVNGGVKRYKVNISQTGTGAPTVTVLENSIGAITYGYTSAGSYTANSSGLFTSGKTFLMLNPTYGTGNSTAVKWNNDSVLDIKALNGLTPTDGILVNQSFLIEVYP